MKTTAFLLTMLVPAVVSAQQKPTTGYAVTGEMLEVALHSKFVHTQIYDTGDMGGSMGGEPSIITVTFNESNGITNVATLIKYSSKADRDAAMSTGMTDGMEMSYQPLDGVLAEGERVGR